MANYYCIYFLVCEDKNQLITRVKRKLKLFMHFMKEFPSVTLGGGVAALQWGRSSCGYTGGGEGLKQGWANPVL